MVEQNVKCDDQEVDSLDVFSQQEFLDSLEPGALREKCDTLVGFHHNGNKYDFLPCHLLIFF